MATAGWRAIREAGRHVHPCARVCTCVYDGIAALLPYPPAYTLLQATLVTAIKCPAAVRSPSTGTGAGGQAAAGVER